MFALLTNKSDLTAKSIFQVSILTPTTRFFFKGYFFIFEMAFLKINRPKD